MDVNFFYHLVYIWIAIAAVIFFALLFVSAPYGRFTRSNWGYLINNRLGWILMETPSLLTFCYFVFTGSAPKNGFILFFTSLWIIHYVHRSFIFPFRIKSDNKKMPLVVALMAVFFNFMNGFFNGYYLGNLYMANNEYSIQNPQFLAGIVFFFFGMGINLHSDQVLINLRKHNPGKYEIPRSGLFRWISSPNYFGEIIEWLGFALMVNSLPAFSFFIWTVANLVPRALDNHAWYKSHFEDYPERRKAVIPYLL
jgi:protein-S-isoprenylcysteine O-methyltransferase Ste14